MKTNLLLFTFLSVFGAMAHPGGLDANGGHTDRKTGVYHFHRGTNALTLNAAPASPIDGETNQIGIEPGAAEPETMETESEAGAATGLLKVQWWIYLSVLGGGYAIWETASYFRKKKKPQP